MLTKNAAEVDLAVVKSTQHGNRSEKLGISLAQSNT